MKKKQLPQVLSRVLTARVNYIFLLSKSHGYWRVAEESRHKEEMSFLKK